MGRAPCCDTSGLKKGPWAPEEDQKIIDYIQKNGYGNWRTLPKNAGLQRCGKSCRLRWTNYLRPDIKRGRFSFEEEETIIQLHSILGNKWSAIAARLPGRTDNEIKNYWNSHIRKRLLRMGIDPVTHSPRLDLLDLSSFLGTSNMYHNSQSSSRLMGMHHSSSSALVDPELFRIAASLMSQSQTNNEVGDYYGQTHFDPLDPTRLIQGHCFNENQLQQEQHLQHHHNHSHHHHHHHHHHQSLMQLHVLQQQVADYVPTTESNILAPDPLSGLYYGSESGHRHNKVDLVNGSEQSSSTIFPVQNSVISTPSSSPIRFDNSNSNFYINSSCTSTEDERENYSNKNGPDYSSGLMRMMKFEIPEGFDVSEFIN